MAHRLEGVGEEVDGRGDDGVEALDAEEKGGEVEAVAVVAAVVVVGMAARHTWKPSILHRQESSFAEGVVALDHVGEDLEVVVVVEEEVAGGGGGGRSSSTTGVRMKMNTLPQMIITVNPACGIAGTGE